MITNKLKNADMSTLSYSTSQPSKKELEQQLMDSVDDVWKEIEAAIDVLGTTMPHPLTNEPLNTDIPKLSKN
jgi:hypothetical protein